MLLSTSMVMISKSTTTVVDADGTTTTTTCKRNTCTTRQNFKNRKKCRSNSCLRHQTPHVVVEEVVPSTVLVEEIAPIKTTRTSTIRTSNLPTRSRKVTEYRTTRPTLLTNADDVVTTTETRTVIQD